MKLNRTSLYVMLLVLVSVLLAACGGKADTPTQVATKYVEALRTGDSGTVTQILTPEMRQFGSSITQAAAQDIPNDGKLHVTLVEEVGNTARIRAEVDLTPEQAAADTTSINTSYRSYRTAFEPLLSADTYHLLFEEEFWTGFFDLTYVADRMRIEEGEPLYPYLENGLDAAALQRYLSTPPKLDETAVNAIEAIAAGINIEETVQLGELREELRPHFAALSEYLLYNRYLNPSDGQVGISTSRKSYFRQYPITLHKVDDKWLVAME